MLIYEKKVKEGSPEVEKRHLFYTTSSAPSASDSRVTFKDADGDVLNDVTFDDVYLDNKHGGMTRKSDGKFVAMLAGTTPVIPNGNWTPEQKVITKIEMAKLPTKVTYTTNETLDTAGMKVNAIYADGDSVEVTQGCTCAPTTFTTAGTVTITVTHTESSKTTTFDVIVTAPVMTGASKKSKKESEE